MRRLASVAVVLLVFSCAAGAAFAADAKVEEQVVGPTADDAKYVVSPRGAHLATVAHKGSRMVVVVDGVEGPKVDSVVTPVTSWVDPRPWEIATHPGGPQPPAPAPVTFSRDGKHYAYLAQVSKEWVLMADGKELARMPASGIVGAAAGVAGMAGNTDIRIEFTGADAKHLLLAKSTFNGYELWVDGQKWPGTYASAGTGAAALDPLVSPDGSHIAYLAQIARDKASLIIDGKEAGYVATNLQWTGDGKHLVGVSRPAGGEAQVLVDGKMLFKAKDLIGVYVAPAGSRIVAVLLHVDPKGGRGQFLLVDGKPVEASLGQTVKHVIFSPDGKHYAAICGQAGAEFVVADGKKGQEYQMVVDNSPFRNTVITFSPDSSKLGYTANTGQKSFVVIDGEESDGYENQAYFVFSPDAKRVAMGGLAGQYSVLAIDGKATRRPRNAPVFFDSFIFSPDASHYAYLAGGTLRDGGPVIVDGKDTGVSGIFSFSPDSKHVAVAGTRSADNKHGLFVDGQLVFPSDKDVIYRAFTPDSQHLYWMAREPAKGPGGAYEFVTYLDGKPVAHCQQQHQSELMLLPTGFGRFANTTPAWEVGADGMLTTLALSEDSVKRVQVTPSADSSLATLLASAQAAEDKGGKRGR